MIPELKIANFLITILRIFRDSVPLLHQAPQIPLFFLTHPVYMLRIAGQTSGPIGLTFFVDSHSKFIFQIFFTGIAGPPASTYYNNLLLSENMKGL